MNSFTAGSLVLCKCPNAMETSKTWCPPNPHILKPSPNDWLRASYMAQGNVPVKLPFMPLLSEKPESFQSGTPTSNRPEHPFGGAGLEAGSPAGLGPAGLARI